MFMDLKCPVFVRKVARVCGEDMTQNVTCSLLTRKQHLCNDGSCLGILRPFGQRYFCMTYCLLLCHMKDYAKTACAQDHFLYLVLFLCSPSSENIEHQEKRTIFCFCCLIVYRIHQSYSSVQLRQVGRLKKKRVDAYHSLVSSFRLCTKNKSKDKSQLCRSPA